jgi:hypothetical protein
LATDAAEEIADTVWDEPIAGHLGAGSTGAALNAAGSAGDPWTTALPGAYGAGTAGFIIGTNLDASVADVEADTQVIQTRLPAALVGGRIDADMGAISTDATAADTLESILDGGGGTITADITGSLSGSVGSVTGAVGSVTGAVGSVTGNVGGNVVGSVASVTGAVGSVTGNVGGNVVGSVASVTGNVGGNVVGSVASVTAPVDVSATGADTIWDEAVDGAVTARQSLRLNNSAAGAKLSGAATTAVAVRDLADTKDRITATVDSDGNRTAVTRDLT